MVRRELQGVRRLGDPILDGQLLNYLSFVASAALRTRTGSHASPEEQALAERLLAATRSHVEPAAYVRDIEHGRSFLLNELIDYAQGVGRRAP